jgi:hypothetical protein
MQKQANFKETAIDGPDYQINEVTTLAAASNWHRGGGLLDNLSKNQSG